EVEADTLRYILRKNPEEARRVQHRLEDKLRAATEDHRTQSTRREIFTLEARSRSANADRLDFAAQAEWYRSTETGWPANYRDRRSASATACPRSGRLLRHRHGCLKRSTCHASGSRPLRGAAKSRAGF